jgi:tetratricopeptide (TPR) repeat protein
MAKAFRRSPLGVAGGSSTPPEPAAGLQLAIGREGVGLEPIAAVPLEAARLVSARARLLGLSFPLDVSGGLSRFRHRRTALVEARLEFDHATVERKLSALTYDQLAPGPCEARVGWRVRDAQATPVLRIELTAGEAQLAFDVSITADDDGVAGYAHRVRGAGTELPLHVVARLTLLRIAEAIGGRVEGLCLRLRDPLRAAMTAAFVSHGARLPSREGVALAAIEPDVEQTRVEFGGTALAPDARAVALIELHGLTARADDAWAAGRVDDARELLLRALERAPKHEAILYRLAELDAAAGDRTEAALAWLREIPRGKRPPPFGDHGIGRAMLQARLHARAGSPTKARGALERAAERAIDEAEPHLASRCFALAASLLDDADPALPKLLDRALGADPTERSARWRRAWLRVLAGDDARALEDVQHVEALTRDRGSRRAMLLRAGELWQRAGRLARAVATYERALRYAPADRAVVGGLARALLAAGAAPRAVELLTRALELPAAEGAPGGNEVDDLAIDLAVALADAIGDLPAAIARARRVGDESRRAALAHALSASFRLRLGDRIGGKQELARTADLVERRGVASEDAARVAEILGEGARAADDRTEARRLALAALSATPHDPDLAALVRALGTEAKIAPEVQVAPTTPPSAMLGAIGAIEEPSLVDEREIERLRAVVQADPTDDASAERLATLLTRAGRDFEAFALLSARWDEATDSQRSAMLPAQRHVLERLVHGAERDGRAVEAGLFREALERLG